MFHFTRNHSRFLAFPSFPRTRESRFARKPGAEAGPPLSRGGRRMAQAISLKRKRLPYREQPAQRAAQRQFLGHAHAAVQLDGLLADLDPVLADRAIGGARA